MIEAKDKEQAVLELHRIYDLQPVHHDSLRPPAEVETLHTQGRKSNKKKAKAKAAAAAAAEGEGDEDGEGIEEGVDPDEAMLDVDGAEVAPPVEGTNAKKAKTPAKRGRAKKESTAVKAENGEVGEQPNSAAKKAATPRKSRAKKAAPAAATKTEEEEKTLEEEVRAEPPEAEPIEDMKMKEVPEPIVDSVPCETPAGSQDTKV
jgi:UV DNA damage endonuclease